jgi:hypothetical protein
MEIPEGYRVRRRRFPGFMISGGVTFGVSYAYGLGSGANNGFENGETWLVLPVVGPFAALAARKLDKCNINVNDAKNVDDIVASKAEVEECFKNSLEEALRLAAITADGVLQTLGASLFVGGAIGGERRLERVEPRVTAGPRAFGQHGIGFGFSGTF